MSIRPLDLQVNINSLNEISRVEGERIAREAAVRRHTEEQIIKDSVLRDSRIEQAAEAQIKPNIKEHADHFGTLNNEEIDSEEFAHHRHNSPHEERGNPSDQPKPDFEENVTATEGEHHLDILA